MGTSATSAIGEWGADCGFYARGVKPHSYMWQLGCDVYYQLWGGLKSWEAVKARVWVNRILTAVTAWRGLAQLKVGCYACGIIAVVRFGRAPVSLFPRDLGLGGGHGQMLSESDSGAVGASRCKCRYWHVRGRTIAG